MTTIINKLSNNFTQISNHAILDPRITGKAYKLYSYMCFRVSLTSSWKFHETEILKHFHEKRDAVRKAKNELIEAGYLKAVQKRNRAGFFGSVDYEIYSSPVNKGSNPSPENPSTDNPSSENPSTENQIHINKDKINIDINKKEFISLSEKEKKEILNEIWKKYNLKSSYEDYFLFRAKDDWKGFSNLIADCRWWENGHKKKFPDKYKTEKEIKKHPLKEKIKKIMSLYQNDYYMYFADGEIKNNMIIVDNKDALKHQELLNKINVKIEVENDN